MKADNNPKCMIGEWDVKNDVFIIDGNPDASYTITANIKNLGKPGPIHITAILETSEGEF